MITTPSISRVGVFGVVSVAGLVGGGVASALPLLV